jgi:peptidoglycan/LPS O-acetylase OafA/YrhL
MEPDLMTDASQHKLANLEVLRFLCSLSVLLFHYPIFSFVGGQYGNPPHDQLPFSSVIVDFYDRGYFAVQYFWCVSGFIFFWKYQDSLRADLSGRDFFILRFSRLYPLHLATLLYIALMQIPYRSMTGMYFTYINNTPLTFFLHLFMLGNLQHPLGDSFNGVMWSVSVELFAYVSFFFVCRYLKFSGLAAPILGVACSFAFIHFSPNNKFLQCFALFYLGGCACIAHRWLERNRLTIAAAIVLFAYYAALTWCRAFWPPSGYFRMVICIPPVVLAFACLPRPKIFLVRWIQRAGELTYSVYLLHFPIILTAVTIAIMFGVHIDYHSRLTFVLFIATVYGAAALCYSRFERPMQRWIRQLLMRPRSRAHVGAVAPD